MTTYCSVHVTLTVAPEKVDEFLETAKPLFETVSAEPHCLSYAVFKSKDNPGEVQLVETYDKSLDWLTEVHKRGYC